MLTPKPPGRLTPPRQPKNEPSGQLVDCLQGCLTPAFWAAYSSPQAAYREPLTQPNALEINVLLVS